MCFDFLEETDEFSVHFITNILFDRFRFLQFVFFCSRHLKKTKTTFFLQGFLHCTSVSDSLQQQRPTCSSFCLWLFYFVRNKIPSGGIKLLVCASLYLVWLSFRESSREGLEHAVMQMSTKMVREGVMNTTHDNVHTHTLKMQNYVVQMKTQLFKK